MNITLHFKSVCNTYCGGRADLQYVYVDCAVYYCSGGGGGGGPRAPSVSVLHFQPLYRLACCDTMQSLHLPVNNPASDQQTSGSQLVDDVRLPLFITSFLCSK